MASGPENRFRASLHRLLPDSVYQMKNNNAYTGGIPDDWYSSTGGDLWVEYKFLSKIPVRTNIRPFDPKQKMLSVLQRDWLNGRYEEGRNVAMIIGCKEGGVILRDQEWMEEITPQAFRDTLLPRVAIAQWIVQQTTR